MKKNPHDLALLGGPPAFAEMLHVGRPNIGQRGRLLERINEILDARWFTNNGPFVTEFEQKVADSVGVKRCVATCNATLAMEIAIRALNLSGEVIIPSFTFVATAHALQWQRITPIFCDIDPRTFTLDPHKVEQMISPRTTGIIGVHTWGRACDTKALGEIASRTGLPIIYDAAHAFGCAHEGRKIGGFGECEIFSFHATKVVNSFEGGAVVTNNDLLADKISYTRNFGFTGWDEVSDLGTNAKMTEVAAAMGLTSLESIEEIIAVNRRNREVYNDSLKSLPGITLIEYDPKEESNYHYVVVDVDPKDSPLTRDELLVVLHHENILARRYFWPGCHRAEPYRSLYPEASLWLAETERVAEQVLVLPTGQTITPEAVQEVCEVLRFALENANEIRRFNNDPALATAERCFS